MIENFRKTGRTSGHVASFDWSDPPNHDVMLMKGDEYTPKPLTTRGYFIDPHELKWDLREKMVKASLAAYLSQP